VAQPDLYLVNRVGEELVLKDYSRRPLLVRWLCGRPVLRREVRALVRLQGLAGVPAFRGEVGKDAFLIGYVRGKGHLGDRPEYRAAGPPSLAFFTALKALIAAVHARGLAHGDIRRWNVLRGPDDSPYLIDYASAVCCHGRCGWLRRSVYRMVARSDCVTALKLQQSCLPGSLTAEEAETLAHPPWYLSVGRFLRKRLYRGMIKQRTWQRRWQRWRAPKSLPPQAPGQ